MSEVRVNHKLAISVDYPEFVPFPRLRNGHAMTIAPSFWPRKLAFAKNPGKTRLFEVEPGARVLTHCHWQPEPRKHPTLLLLHGLEGSTEAAYMLGTAEKAFRAGMNVVRMNHRNCGGSLHLAPSLYNSGLSNDPKMVARELREVDGLPSLFVAGWSLGGNVMLKMSAELAEAGPQLLSGVCAVSPSLDLHPCVNRLEEGGFNRFYELWFLSGLKEKIKLKHQLYPDLYDPGPLAKIKSIRTFDDTYTAPLSGYGTAQNYYTTASSLPIADRISVPTLILHSKDDPFVPYSSFMSPKLKTDYIQLILTDHGGHAGFIHKDAEGPPHLDRFWAENRVVAFCRQIYERQG